ncbi:DUF4168 domain-containing protein [Phormidium sp. CCY1219]|jgi:hypothetical protein|uniref:DUF4168 domain-containing protein n=1 Tax=Phormidium sp. CCY1219 TaxID=2886104 RepID=UPI002D1F58B7|nr:DUF4168 domain-containing protein [Phormidium sp. CCY1219]MEB3830500.1 DUF4168 domain-containing protein [Phormidium sp. CCY1219]
MLSKSLLVGVLSAVGVLSGVAVHLSPDTPTLVFHSAAYAQEVTNEEIANYARAILAIEPLRLEASEEISSLTGSVPAINCSQTDRVNDLDESIRGIAVNYCEQSKNLVATNGLSVTRFNEITAAMEFDPELEKRVKEELRRLQ